MSTPLPETRERILRETWRLLEEGHGQGVRLEDVARAAGVSRQAVYLHFASRTELFIATARYVDHVLRLEERLQEVCAATSGAQGIDAYVAFWASYAPEIYGIAKALLSVRDSDEAAAAAWADRMKGVREGCVAIMRCAERDGTLAPDWSVDEAADALYAMLSLATWELLTMERGWTQAQYVERMQRIVKRALLRPA